MYRSIFDQVILNMSNHLFRIITYIMKTLSRKTGPVTTIELGANVVGLVITSGIHVTYALSTEKEEEIQIARTYKMNRFGFTDFMVVDHKGRHFNVNNSLWYWKWNSVEEWASLHKGDTLAVQYYGWRKPVFGLFPNIVRVDKSQK